jgi:hypothetical protein
LCNSKENFKPIDSITATTFDPFDALRLFYNVDHLAKDIRSAYLAASRRAHDDKRPATTAKLFPSFSQVKDSYDYLIKDYPYCLRNAAITWQRQYTRSWNPQATPYTNAWLPLQGLNDPTATTSATPSSSRNPSAANNKNNNSGSGSRFTPNNTSGFGGSRFTSNNNTGGSGGSCFTPNNNTGSSSGSRYTPNNNNTSGSGSGSHPEKRQR